MGMGRSIAPLLLWLCWVMAPAQAAGSERPLLIGSKNFTESVILGELVTQLLIARGFAAEHRPALGGSRILWNALQRGDIDFYPEYSGTLRFELLAGADIGADQLASAPLSQLLRPHGIAAMESFGFVNNYALGMQASQAEELGIERVSDLLKHPGLRIGVSNEFLHRSDGWPGLKTAYQLSQQATGLDHDLAYRGLVAGDLDLIDLYTTDAEISYYQLRLLEDDLHYFPNYHAQLLFRQAMAQTQREALASLQPLSGLLSESEISRLNSLHKLKKQPVKQVAIEFLAKHLLVDIEQNQQNDSIWQALWITSGQQLYLVGWSLFFALLVGLPLGIWAAKNRFAGQLILGITGAIQTIPSLALLVFMIPLLGIGTLPALVALFAYSLLPIIRNTEAGLRGISDDLKETAVAMGLTTGEQLWHIELPLASRMILAGIKTAAVINIGTATLGALIGAGGYGQPILAGIRLDDTSLILQGAIPAALMAFLVQGGFGWLEKRLPAAS